MSLPPGFLDELRGRVSLSQVVGRKVSWDQKKSNRAKGDWWAPCPFHQEKSASFHCDDRKGFFYCFGCQAKGDAITFVIESENVGFMEAVEILAGEAGMQMPARDPQAAKQADRRTELTQVMEEAVRFYQLQLKTARAAEARAYLERRGLASETQARFELGFAPEGWQTLWDHLTAKGIAPERIVECGLGKKSDKSGKFFDIFRNRILFPIRDARGRAIAFGGRAMDPEDKAKYLNSPETPLFDKSRTLYNHGPAREAAGKGQPLVVAEGYMDVIALSEAGFTGAVAPLGTAVTEAHLEALWRIADEPLIALDGDSAGLNAAYRVIGRALPMLAPGRSLRFALMPAGKDPDDLLRAEGPEAVSRVLGDAVPMVQLLWRELTEGRAFDSPERRAALDRELRERLGAIRDAGLRRHYDEAVRELRYQLFRPNRGTTGAGRTWQPPGAFRRDRPQPPSAAAKASALAAAGEADPGLREGVILVALLVCPEILDEFEADLEAMACRDPQLARLRDALLAEMPASAEAARAAAERSIGSETLETLLRSNHFAINPVMRNPGDAELARLAVSEELAKLAADEAHRAELAEAEAGMAQEESEAVTWRLRQAAEARLTAARAQRDEDREYDKGENGALIDRGERLDFDALMKTIRFSKSQR